MRLTPLLDFLQSGQSSKVEWFTVTAGVGSQPAGLSVLDALCQGQGAAAGADWGQSGVTEQRSLTRLNSVSHYQWHTWIRATDTHGQLSYRD